MKESYYVSQEFAPLVSITALASLRQLINYLPDLSFRVSGSNQF